MKYKICSTKDFLISGEPFEIIWDKETQIAKTHPIPEKKKLQGYYNSREYYSHSGTKTTPLDILYRISQKITFRYKVNIILKYARKKIKLLDYGCGVGAFLNYSSKNFDVFGLEPIKIARVSALQKGLRVEENIKEILNKRFDVITFWHVFEHLYSPDNQMVNIKKVLNKKGILIIAAPNLKSYDAKKYRSFWAAYDAPRHLWHFSEKGIIKMLKRHNFKFLESKPLFLDALYVSYLSEKYRKSKIPFIKGVFWGLISNLMALKSGEYSSKIYIFKKN